MMPGITGLELVKHFKGDSKLKSVPIFIMSNLLLGDIEKEALKAGAEKFINKTQMQPEQIVDTVTKVIKN